MKIRYKLMVGLLGTSLACGAIALTSISTNRQIEADARELMSSPIKLDEGASGMNAALVGCQEAAEELMAERRRALLGGPDKEVAEAGARKADKEILSSISRFEEILDSVSH